MNPNTSYNTDMENTPDKSYTLRQPPFMRRNASQVSIASIQSLPSVSHPVLDSKNRCWELIVSTGFRRRSQLGTFYSRSRCVSTYSLPQSIDPQRPSTVGMLSSQQLPPLSFGHFSNTAQALQGGRNRTRTFSSQEYPGLRTLGVPDHHPSSERSYGRSTRPHTAMSPLGSNTGSFKSGDGQDSVSTKSSATEDSSVVFVKGAVGQEPRPSHQNRMTPRPSRNPGDPSTHRRRFSRIARDDRRRHSSVHDMGVNVTDHTRDIRHPQNFDMDKTKQRVSVVQVHSIDTVMASSNAIVSRQVSERGTIKTVPGAEPTPEFIPRDKSGQNDSQQSSFVFVDSKSSTDSTRGKSFTPNSSETTSIDGSSGATAATEAESSKIGSSTQQRVEQAESTSTIQVASHEGQDDRPQATTFRGLSPLGIIRRTISSTFTKS